MGLGRSGREQKRREPTPANPPGSRYGAGQVMICERLELAAATWWVVSRIHQYVPLTTPQEEEVRYTWIYMEVKGAEAG